MHCGGHDNMAKKWHVEGGWAGEVSGEGDQGQETGMGEGMSERVGGWVGEGQSSHHSAGHAQFLGMEGGKGRKTSSLTNRRVATRQTRSTIY